MVEWSRMSRSSTDVCLALCLICTVSLECSGNKGLCKASTQAAAERLAESFCAHPPRVEAVSQTLRSVLRTFVPVPVRQMGTTCRAT